MLFIASGMMATLALFIHLPIAETFVHDLRKTPISFFTVLKVREYRSLPTSSLFGFGLAASNGFVSLLPVRGKSHSFLCITLPILRSAVLTRLLGVRLADRLGEERIIPYAMILTGLGLAGLVFLSGSLILVLAGLMAGCGHGFLYPALNALAIRNGSTQSGERSPESYRQY